jgi:hypothetical protein
LDRFVRLGLCSAYAEPLLELRTCGDLGGWTREPVTHEGSMRMQGIVACRKQINYDFRILKEINCSKKPYIMRIELVGYLHVIGSRSAYRN